MRSVCCILFAALACLLFASPAFAATPLTSCDHLNPGVCDDFEDLNGDGYCTELDCIASINSPPGLNGLVNPDNFYPSNYNEYFMDVNGDGKPDFFKDPDNEMWVVVSEIHSDDDDSQSHSDIDSSDTSSWFWYWPPTSYFTSHQKLGSAFISDAASLQATAPLAFSAAVMFLTLLVL